MSDTYEVLIDDDEADRLLAELGDALASEISDAHIEAAIDAFWIGRTEALVAELEEHLDADQRASVRGASGAREHVYRLDALLVSLNVDDVDHHVEGRIQGGYESARWLDGRGSSRPLELDQIGRFRITLPAGPAAIEVALTDGRTVRTRWTLL